MKRILRIVPFDPAEHAPGTISRGGQCVWAGDTGRHQAVWSVELRRDVEYHYAACTPHLHDIIDCYPEPLRMSAPDGRSEPERWRVP